jgi:hypothetical protein
MKPQETAKMKQSGGTHLLKVINELGDRLVCPVADLVPVEGAQVLIGRLWGEAERG